MILTDSILRALNKGFHAKFLGGVGKVNRDAELLAMKSSSSASYEVYGDIGFMPSMKKLVGEAIVTHLREQAKQVKNEEFTATVAVKALDIKNDKIGIYKPAIAQMGRNGAKLPSQLIADLLLNGFTAKDYTGTAFFAADKKHFTGGKKTFTNLGTKKLSAANFQTARAAIRSVLDEDGVPLGIGDELALVVSPDYEATAKGIVQAEYLSGGGSNVNKGTAKVVVLPHLASSPHKWFLIDIGQEVGALVLQENQALQMLSTADGAITPELLLKHEYLYQAYWAGNADYLLPQLAYGSTGADAA